MNKFGIVNPKTERFFRWNFSVVGIWEFQICSLETNTVLEICICFLGELFDSIFFLYSVYVFLSFL